MTIKEQIQQHVAPQLGPHDDHLVVYISGAITGLDPEQARYMFNEAVEALRAQGYLAINPYTLGDAAWSWSKNMEVCLEALHNAEAIYFLPGAENSPGATVEAIYARKLDLPTLSALRLHKVAEAWSTAEAPPIVSDEIVGRLRGPHEGTQREDMEQARKEHHDEVAKRATAEAAASAWRSVATRNCADCKTVSEGDAIADAIGCASCLTRRDEREKARHFMRKYGQGPRRLERVGADMTPEELEVLAAQFKRATESAQAPHPTLAGIGADLARFCKKVAPQHTCETCQVGDADVCAYCTVTAGVPKRRRNAARALRKLWHKLRHALKRPKK